MTTSTETETGARIDAAGLSAMIAAAGLFTLGKPRKGSGLSDDPPRYCRVRVAAAGGVLGIEATDATDCRFTAVIAPRGGVPNFDAMIDADAIASTCRGGGFDSAIVTGDRFTARGATIDAKPVADPWPIEVADPSAIAARIVIDAGTVARIAREVAVASDPSTSRYALGGIAFDVEPAAPGERYGRSHAIATDGRRLHVLTIPRSACPVGDAPATAEVVIVPASVIVRAAKAIAGTIPRGVDPETVAVTIDASPTRSDGNRESVSIQWIAGDFTATITAKPVVGRFPRWRDVLTGEAARGALIGDAGAGDPVSTWSGDAKAIVAACRDAIRGVCRPGKRGGNPSGVDFTAGDQVSGGADRFPRMSAKTAAGAFDRVLGAGAPDNVGLASPGFAVKLNPDSVIDALAGFPRGELARLATDAARVGEAAVFVRRGRGIDAEHVAGFTAVIMPLGK